MNANKLFLERRKMNKSILEPEQYDAFHELDEVTWEICYPNICKLNGFIELTDYLSKDEIEKIENAFDVIDEILEQQRSVCAKKKKASIFNINQNRKNILMMLYLEYYELLKRWFDGENCVASILDCRKQIKTLRFLL